MTAAAIALYILQEFIGIDQRCSQSCRFVSKILKHVQMQQKPGNKEQIITFSLVLGVFAYL